AQVKPVSRKRCVVMTRLLHRVCDEGVAPMQRSVREEFAEDGFTVIRGLLDAPQADGFAARLRALGGKTERWAEPAGVNRQPRFWPLIFDDRLLTTVREALGPSVRYLPHTDLHVGFSSFSWHRDSVTRRFGDGADWDETSAPYRLARVGIYLQRYR